MRSVPSASGRCRESNPVLVNQQFHPVSSSAGWSDPCVYVLFLFEHTTCDKGMFHLICFFEKNQDIFFLYQCRPGLPLTYYTFVVLPLLLYSTYCTYFTITPTTLLLLHYYTIAPITLITLLHYYTITPITLITLLHWLYYYTYTITLLHLLDYYTYYTITLIALLHYYTY